MAIISLWQILMKFTDLWLITLELTMKIFSKNAFTHLFGDRHNGIFVELIKLFHSMCLSKLIKYGLLKFKVLPY